MDGWARFKQDSKCPGSAVFVSATRELQALVEETTANRKAARERSSPKHETCTSCRLTLPSCLSAAAARTNPNTFVDPGDSAQGVNLFHGTPHGNWHRQHRRQRRAAAQHTCRDCKSSLPLRTRTVWYCPLYIPLVQLLLNNELS